MLVANVPKSRRDPIEKGLGANEAVVGQHIGAIGEMLAGAKADLEMKWAVIAEQPLGGDFALLGHRDRRQQPLDELLLTLAQLVTARSAIEPVECQRIARLERRHWQPPLLVCVLAATNSQE